jgi:hypothetical protein
MSNVIPAGAPAATVTPATTPDAAATAAPDAAAAVTPDASAAPAKTLEEVQAELDTWKGHARTWEERAKENKTAKEKLDEIEASKLTETQRLQKELDDLRADKDKTDRALLLSGVAAAKGVPAALLTGATKEELEAAADALLAFRGAVKPPANDTAASGSKGEPISAGAQITSREVLKTMSAGEIQAAKAAGRLNTLLGIK